MTQDRGPAAAPEPSEPEQIKAEIEETREDLGDTVEALAEKADVKSQAKAKVDERKQALKEKQQQLKGQVAGIPSRAREMKPEDAKRLASETATKAKARPGPTAGVVLVVGFLLLRLLRRR